MLPTLTIETCYGHTLGHSILGLHSSRENAISTGDAFHHPLQLTDPRIQVGDCDDLNGTIISRRELVRNAMVHEAQLIPAHLPAPHAGSFTKENGETVFRAYGLR